MTSSDMPTKVGLASLATITVACAIIMFADKVYNTMKGLINKSHAVSTVIKEERISKKSSQSVKDEKSSQAMKNEEVKKQNSTDSLSSQSKSKNGGGK